MKIDLSKIEDKEYISKPLAFEALCCTLFEAYGMSQEQKWDESAEYINKNGAGGDAGVEAYWKFNNGDEFGLQAKFLFDFDKFISQTTDSIKEALNKHPNITEYHIFVPIDRTDLKDKNRKSQKDQWDDALKRWKKIPKSSNAENTEDNEVKFIYWGSAEIKVMLMRDEPLMRGLCNYFFHNTPLSNQWFSIMRQQAIQEAGPRYTEEIHQEDNEVDNIHIFSAPESLKRQFLMEKKKLLESVERFISEDICDGIISDEIDVLIEHNKGIHSQIENLAYNRLNDAKKILNEAESVFGDYYWELSKELKDDKKEQDLSYSYRQLEFGTFKNLCVYKNAKTLLITGKAGAGKTHFSCDFMKQCNSLNTALVVVIMGHTLSSCTDILEKALIENLDGYDDFGVFLDALNVFAKARGKNAILIIDGLNEWSIKDHSQIKNQLQRLIRKLDDYSNIKLIVNYREEYLKELIVGDEYYPNYFNLAITLTGFANPIKSFYSILNHYNVSVKSLFPFMPDYSNPLVVKTICETYSGQSLPDSFQGISRVFDYYLDSINTRISRKLGLHEESDTVKKVIVEIVKVLVNNNYSYVISLEKLKDSIKHIDVNCHNDWLNSILFHLEKDGFLLISRDFTYFSYQRLADYLFSNQIMTNSLQGPDFDWNDELKKIIGKPYSFYGILELLSIAYPEKNDHDLIIDMREKIISIIDNADDWEQQEIKRNFIISFFSSLPHRNPKSITEKTIEKFNDFKSYYNEEYWKTVIECAGIPNHPLNAQYLHNTLFNLAMADIDSDWSQFISLHWEKDYDPEDYGYNNKNISLYHIITPYIEIDTSRISTEQAQLLCTLFIWLTVSTNRELRNTATLACVNILRGHKSLIVPIFDKFSDLNDLYQKERLYVIMEGVSCFIKDTEILGDLSEKIYNSVFNQKTVFPNIIVRCSAYYMIKNAEEKGVDISNFKNSIEPPYNYPIIPRISKEEVDIRKEKFDNYDYPKRRIYSSSCVDDFAVYGVSSIGYWLDIPLSSPLLDEYSNKKMQGSGYHNIVNEHTLWICEKAYSFDWEEEKHEEFDKINRGEGRGEKNIERIGKKYQRLAYHEYLCNLSDNYYYAGFWRNDGCKPSHINMGEMCSFKDIDPTILVPKLKYDNSITKMEIWRRQYLHHDEVYKPLSLEEQIEWLEDTDYDLSQGDKSFIVEYNDEDWIILYDHLVQEEEHYNSDSEYVRDFHIRISATITTNNDKEKYIKMLKSEHEDGNNGFGEAIKHTFQIRDSYLADSPKRQRDIECSIDNEYKEYSYFEVGMERLTEHINFRESFFHVPHFKLLELLDLELDDKNVFQWNDRNGNPIIKNIITETGKDILIANKSTITNLLDSKEYSLLTKIATEKRIIPVDLYETPEEYYKNGMNVWHYHLSTYDITKQNISELFSHNFSS